MYVMGGSHWDTSTITRTYFNDVWTTNNGVNWSMVTQYAPWVKRHGHTAVVFNNKIWVMGGQTEDNESGDYMPLNDIWSSTDGLNWTKELEHAPWAARSMHTATVFNNKIWVMGGGFNDVWSSVDGIHWIEETEGAPWELRWGHVSFVFNNKLWVVGGFNYYPEVSTVYADAWSSSDGENWTQETSEIPELSGDRPTGIVLPDSTASAAI
jgi:hypothetical protein